MVPTLNSLKLLKLCGNRTRVREVKFSKNFSYSQFFRILVGEKLERLIFFQEINPVQTTSIACTEKRCLKVKQMDSFYDSFPHVMLEQI